MHGTPSWSTTCTALPTPPHAQSQCLCLMQALVQRGEQKAREQAKKMRAGSFMRSAGDRAEDTRVAGSAQEVRVYCCAAAFIVHAAAQPCWSVCCKARCMLMAAPSLKR